MNDNFQGHYTPEISYESILFHWQVINPVVIGQINKQITDIKIRNIWCKFIFIRRKPESYRWFEWKMRINRIQLMICDANERSFRSMESRKIFIKKVLKINIKIRWMISYICTSKTIKKILLLSFSNLFLKIPTV